MRFVGLMIGWMALSLAACSAQGLASTPTNVPAPAASPTGTVAPTVEPTAVPSLVPSVVPTSAIPQTGPSTTPGAAPTTSGSATLPFSAHDCGQIMMLGPNPPRDSAALQSEQCFWQAFQECRLAVLVVTMRGVDAGTLHEFSIQKTGSGCGITDMAQSYVIPLRTPTAQPLICAGLTQKDRGLLFTSCGDRGDIFVPAPGTP